MKYPANHLTPFPPTFPGKIISKRILSAKNSARAPAIPLSTFRMNTCKSVSKQRTLTPFRMNTYAKTGGRGYPSLLRFAISIPAATINSMRLRTLCIALLSLVPAATSAQTVDEILAKVTVARGGSDKLRAIHSERVSGEISFGDVSGPFVVELERPLKMHMQLTIQNQTMVRVYDGQSQG